MNTTVWALLAAVYVACIVETVEATTVVLAMGITRGWRSTLLGVGTALAALAAVTAIGGYALIHWLPVSALQLVIGGLLLAFGLQWIRKAVYRASGRKSLHDEDEIFSRQLDAARAAGERQPFDMFGFMVSLKSVFLEGMEVVFIVLTFGLNAGRIPSASLAAVAAIVTVVVIAVIARRPLAMIPENTLKYGVGLMLASFGSFWAFEGLGVLRGGHASVAWPGADWSILVLLVAWFLVSRVMIRALRPASAPATEDAAQPSEVLS
ncbi:MAG TPA: hypothetical protein VHO26_02775 [Propionibacteriaceae bacterium]|nr:hypothetical protein [Propionibacteriaceae bacterium]